MDDQQPKNLHPFVKYFIICFLALSVGLLIGFFLLPKPVPPTPKLTLNEVMSLTTTLTNGQTVSLGQVLNTVFIICQNAPQACIPPVVPSQTP